MDATSDRSGKKSHGGEILLHSIPPVWDERSRILILGSFPSARSRETSFFYGHPQNRFWRVLSELLEVPLPTSVEEKKRLLLSHGIALWDVVGRCRIVGSSDSSIREVSPNPVGQILSSAPITRVFTNGKTAEKLYRKYLYPSLGTDSVCLPSTSPANASKTLSELLGDWKVILDF